MAPAAAVATLLDLRPGAEEADSPSSSSDCSAPDADADWYDVRTSRQRRVDCLLLNLCGIMFQADNALLPAVYMELGQEFGVGPSELGVLTLLRGVTEALFALPAGFLADIVPRPRLICAAVLVWAVGIISCGFVPGGQENYHWLVLCRMLNGAGLGVTQPLLYSLISDTNRPSRRGVAFGTVQFTGNVGSVVGGLIVTVVAPMSNHQGWRWTFKAFGLMSALIGLGIGLHVREPRADLQAKREGRGIRSVVRAHAPDLWRILKIPTFLVIIAQGVTGTAPWFAFSYLTMWLELACFDHRQAAAIVACFGGGQALAGLLGGRLLDAAAARFPDHGPPCLCMTSVGVGVPLFALVFHGLVDAGVDVAGTAPGGTLATFCATFAVIGSTIAWSGIANNKIFGDIVPPRIYTYIFALDRCLEGAFGALGTPAVGLVTDRLFRYDSSSAQRGLCSRPDAHSLGNGIFSVAATMWALTFLFYCLLHRTYPRDRRLAAAMKKDMASSGSSSDNDR